MSDPESRNNAADVSNKEEIKCLFTRVYIPGDEGAKKKKGWWTKLWSRGKSLIITTGRLTIRKHIMDHVEMHSDYRKSKILEHVDWNDWKRK